MNIWMFLLTAINKCVWVIQPTFDYLMFVLVDWGIMRNVFSMRSSIISSMKDSIMSSMDDSIMSTMDGSMMTSMVSILRLTVAILEGVIRGGLYSWAMTSLHHLVT